MRFLTELLIFFVIAAIAATIGAGIIWLCGQPLHLKFSQSFRFSVVGLIFVFPAVVNIWIMFRGGGKEGVAERVLAGVRGFGMLLCATAAVLVLAISRPAWKPFTVCFIVGTVLLFGSIPIEMWLRHRRYLKNLDQQKQDSGDSERPDGHVPSR